jgi:hypothetical protein
MNDLLHTMHEAMEACNTEMSLELAEVNTALTNQGEVIHNQAVFIDSLRLLLDTCNANWEQFEGEINLVFLKSLTGPACLCAQAPSPEQLPNPSFPHTNSHESYHTPPVTSPPRENLIPLPITMAHAVLDSEKQAPISYDTGSEANEAEVILMEAQRAYQQEVMEDTTCQLVRARQWVPLG